MTMLMAVPAGSPSRRGGHDDPARRRVGALMRTALAWAGSGAALCCLAWLVLGAHQLLDLASAAIGGALALAFLAAGRSVQVLIGGGTAVSAWALFGAQILVLGLAGAVVVDGRLLASWGIGSLPMGTCVAAVALAWTVGVVVAGIRRGRRIYDRGEGR